MLCEHNSTAAFLLFLRISFCCGLFHNFQKNDVKLTDLQRCTLPHPLFLKHWHDIIFLSRFRNFLSVKRPTGNHRAGQVQRDGRGSSGPLTLLKQDHPTRNCTALCPGSSGVFTGRETSHILSQIVGFFPFFFLILHMSHPVWLISVPVGTGMSLSPYTAVILHIFL